MNVENLVCDEISMGNGSTSTVWKARYHSLLIPVAVKRIPKSGTVSETEKTQTVREIALHKQLDHPFIVKLFDVIETPTEFILVQELVEYGNLRNLINKRRRLNEKLARHYFIQLMSAVEYLHCDRHVVHRDIKCDNILIDRFDNIRLIDFGLSRNFQNPTDVFMTQCGSAAYVAPEVFLNKGYGTSADIWSCGIVLYGMLAGVLPFYDECPRQNLLNICSAPLEFPFNMSPSVVDLISKILCKDPKLRIGIDGILDHPWFSVNDFSAVRSAATRFYHASNSEIETGTIARMEIDGIDCSRFMTLERKVIYEVYKRTILTEMMDLVVRGLDSQRCASLPIAGKLASLFGVKLRADETRAGVRSRPAEAGQRRYSEAATPVFTLDNDDPLEPVATPRPGYAYRPSRLLAPLTGKG
jgi:serine/threonine protein kinase